MLNSDKSHGQTLKWASPSALSGQYVTLRRVKGVITRGEGWSQEPLSKTGVEMDTYLFSASGDFVTDSYKVDRMKAESG